MTPRKVEMDTGIVIIRRDLDEIILETTPVHAGPDVDDPLAIHRPLVLMSGEPWIEPDGGLPSSG